MITKKMATGGGGGGEGHVASNDLPQTLGLHGFMVIYGDLWLAYYGDLWWFMVIYGDL